MPCNARLCPCAAVQGSDSVLARGALVLSLRRERLGRARGDGLSVIRVLARFRWAGFVRAFIQREGGQTGGIEGGRRWRWPLRARFVRGSARGEACRRESLREHAPRGTTSMRAMRRALGVLQGRALRGCGEQYRVAPVRLAAGPRCAMGRASAIRSALARVNQLRFARGGLRGLPGL